MTQTFHYEAAFSNGKVFKRSSPRTYTHAVLNSTKGGYRQEISWCGRPDLAVRLAGEETVEPKVVKITGKP